MGKRNAYRVYSDEERLAALAALDACGGDLSWAARETGIPRTTVAAWANGHVHPQVTKFRQQGRAALADRLEELAHQCLDLLPARMADAPLRHLVAALAVCIDKMLLLREQPTAITSAKPQAPLAEEERLRQLAALFENARVRSNGKAPPTA